MYIYVERERYIIYIYIYICIYIYYTSLSLYIYIYREREKGREGECLMASPAASAWASAQSLRFENIVFVRKSKVCLKWLCSK